jgi:hypothetical protein
MATDPLSADALRAQVLARFREQLRPVTEAELRRLLEDGLFNDIKTFSEDWDQLRLMAEELTKLAPGTDREILLMLPIVLARLSEWFQRTVLDFPIVAVAPTGVDGSNRGS